MPLFINAVTRADVYWVINVVCSGGTLILVDLQVTSTVSPSPFSLFSRFVAIFIDLVFPVNGFKKCFILFLNYLNFSELT